MIGCLRGLARSLASVSRRFRLDARGNVAIIFAFASTALLVGTGAGIDLSRAYFARQKLSQVATLACQFSIRPSVVNSGATTLYNNVVNAYAKSQLTAMNWPSTSMPTGGTDGSASTFFTGTGAGVSNNNQVPSGVAELWYNMPTTFMKIANVNQITVHAVMNCQPPPASTCSSVPGSICIHEGFETARTSYYFTNPSGGTGALSSPQNTFPTTAGYQGDSGNQFYIMGYCMEIDQTGVINASSPEGSHTAELDCDNGSGSAGNSSLTTKAYLAVGYYELRYFYRSRVDYPNYDPAYICGTTGPTYANPTAGDIGWANDSAGSTYGTRTNQVNVYLDQSISGAAPPLHTTLDGTQQLAGGNLIDTCVQAPSWVERSVKIKITTAAYYWLSFAADGHNDSYGAQIDNIRLCYEQCTGALQDNFPANWTTNVVLFEDTFSSPTYTAGTAPNLSYAGDLANSYGATVSTCSGVTSAPAGWPCQAATGWATAPYNQVNVYTKGAYTGFSQYIAIDGNNGSTTNRLISRPFLLVPGYYQVAYDYVANVNFPSLTTTFCTAAPPSGFIYQSSYGNSSGTARYGPNISTDYTTNISGVFMSHGQLVSTPNVAGAPWAVSSDTNYTAPALGAATSYTNPNGTVSTTPITAPDAVSYPSYVSTANNPLLDTCGYSPSYAWQTRNVSIKISKSGIYWLTFSANGGVADGYGAGIDDVKLTALGSPYMSNPPVTPLVTIPTPAPAPNSNYSNGGAFTGFYIVADPFSPPAADQ